MSDIEHLIKTTADACGLTRAELLGGSKARHLAQPRWALMRALSREWGWSTPRIGRALGRRDHTTVWHGLKRAEELCTTNPEFSLLCDWVAKCASNYMTQTISSSETPATPRMAA